MGKKCFILFCENKNSNKKNYKNQNIKFNNNKNSFNVFFK